MKCTLMICKHVFSSWLLLSLCCAARPIFCLFTTALTICWTCIQICLFIYATTKFCNSYLTISIFVGHTDNNLANNSNNNNNNNNSIGKQIISSQRLSINHRPCYLSKTNIYQTVKAAKFAPKHTHTHTHTHTCLLYTSRCV